MKVSLRKTGKIAFDVTTDSGHTLAMDGAPDHGGTNAGPRPMELVLASLGGCSSIDVALILAKSRLNVTDCQVTIEGERANTVPAVFTRIHAHYTIVGRALDPKKVERAVTLSMEKYCSVTRMLQPSVHITHDVEIREP